jgi:hypothetical protein
MLPSRIPNEPEVSQTVLALGDSNLYLMEGSILTSGTTRPPGSQEGMLLTAINAKPGFGACPKATFPANYWTQFLAHAREVATWPVYFILLGVNDAKREPSVCTSNYGTVIDNIMREIPSTSQVYWPNVPQAELPSTPFINADLAVAETRWPNLHVLPLAARWAGKHNRILADRLHYSYLGDGELARWVFGPEGVIARATSGEPAANGP